MSEIDINGILYRCGRMPTRTQLHVVKRLTPVWQGFGPFFGRDISVADALAAVTNTIGLLSDEDVDYVLDAALSCVAWRQGAAWQPLRAPGGVFLNGNADRLDVQLRLLWEVLQESLSDFSFGLLLPSLAGPNGMDQQQAATEEATDTPQTAMSH